MRVRKIMNWPLTLFTLLAIGTIGIFGFWLAERAFLSEWGREHIKYDGYVETVQNNMNFDYASRIQNVDGFAEVVENGACSNEEDLIELLNSVISQGQWDEYGFVGKTHRAFDKEGEFLPPIEAGGLYEIIGAQEEDSIFWASQGTKEYLFFTKPVTVNGKDLTLFFAASAENLLSNAIDKSEIDENPAALISERGVVLSVMNMSEALDYSSLKPTDFYDNPSGEISNDFLQKIQSAYMSENVALQIEYAGMDEAGNTQQYVTTVEDEADPVTEKVDLDTGEKDTIEIDMNAPAHSEFHDFTKKTFLGKETNLKEYRVILANDQLWYKKDLKCPGLGNVTLLSGKPMEISGEMLQQSSYILLIYFVVLFILFIMFVMQMIFTAHSNRKLVKVAYIDPITKSRNWNRFVLDAKKLLRKRKNRNYAMVMYDVDKFNVYNDLYGHPEGNILLAQIGKFFAHHLGKREIFTRCGADHFVVLMYWESEEELEKRILRIKEEIMKMFSARFVRLTVGVYKIVDYNQSLDRMYTFTSIAQEKAKQHRDMELAYFSDTQRQMLLRENELENSMEDALKNHEFKVYLQPKYYSDGSKIGGAEALVRWISKELGFISPGDFIPLFEKNGFVKKLDNYMVDAVCALQRQWLDEGKELITISVNISRVHLLDPKLVDDVVHIVDSYNLPHSCIELELTESAFFDAKDVLIRTIKQFQKLGFEISMDDFGSGYSSLNSLKDLPLDVIKLDGEFFKETEDTERGTKIVKDTIQLAKHLNMRIVAEGIEKKEQVDFLQNIGCDLIQGFYFAKPMPVEDFEKVWAEKK